MCELRKEKTQYLHYLYIVVIFVGCYHVSAVVFINLSQDTMAETLWQQYNDIDEFSNINIVNNDNLSSQKFRHKKGHCLTTFNNISTVFLNSLEEWM